MSWRRVILILSFILASRAGQAQVSLQWAACYNGPANNWDTGMAITVDDSGHVYVTGSSVGVGTDRDYVTVKYDRNGDSIWIRRFNGPENGFDVSKAIVVDNSENVYITGTSVAATIRYDRFGNQLWVRRFGQFSAGYRILLGTRSDIIVGGESNADFIVVSYDTAGNLLWSVGYNGTANGSDRINDMVLDSYGNIIVAGQSEGVGTHWDYATVKYSPIGDTMWVRRYNGPAPTFPGDYAYALTVDDSDNIYVTGWSDGANERPQCFTIKYSPDGDSLWSHRYPSAGNLGFAGYDITYDPRGFIYVVARSNGHNDTVLKYDLKGNLVWSVAYVTDHTFVPDLARITLDSAGNVYLSSHNSVANVHSDYVVVKFSPSGSMMWEYKYPGGQQAMTNEIHAIHVDRLAHIYVTGRSHACPPGEFNMLTLKLSQDPTGMGSLPSIPQAYELEHNYPNPFNSTTTIGFSVLANAYVSLKVFDVLGRVVATIVSEELPAGKYSREWFVEHLPSGVYLYRMQAGHFSQTKKLVLLR